VKNVNVDEARIQGLEARYQWRQDAWNLDSSLLLQDPRDLSNHRQLLRRARVSAKTRLQYDRGVWHGGLEAIYSGKRDDVDGISFNPTTTAPYTLVNLSAAYDLDRSWQLFGRVDNLFDRDYEVVSQYNTPGRSLFVGVKYQTD
jgi:vitamin B12 transporter